MKMKTIMKMKKMMMKMKNAMKNKKKKMMNKWKKRIKLIIIIQLDKLGLKDRQIH
jgi:hypothetical protein